MLGNNIIITDIGSTTTKALLLQRKGQLYHFIDYEIAPTTVESPSEDVKIGIYNAIKRLEQKQNLLILQPTADKDNISFIENYTYLTTSSAGGGLQIFVIGLIKTDSVLSAKKVAYGVGGVLLDILSIDDERTTLDRVTTLNNSHPDIILFCGGVDRGALNGVYRLAEILKIAKPTPKFSDHKIPLVYAGNCEASEYINTLSNEKYDLFIVDNIRPTIKDENLDPAKHEIHDLFMNNVMEQAPGYIPVKKMVYSNIIPTPAGVLNTFKCLGKRYNFMLAFDIGGATTDIFSNIGGKYFRSVNANSGMGYSIGNVLKDINFVKDIRPYISFFDVRHSIRFAVTSPNEENNFAPMGFEEYFLNYIGNKVLYPTSNPDKEIDIFIEHLMAICSIKMSIKQHFDMHFMEIDDKIYGYYKQLTKRDFIYETTYHPRLLSNYLFKMSDIEVFIGTGGVISHATKEQAIFIMIEALSVTGFTEFWRDKHFISPHLGVLSNVNEGLAEYLINNECFERLAVYFRPKYLKYTGIIMKVKIDSSECNILSNEVRSFIFDKKVKVEIVSKQRWAFPDCEFELEGGVRLVIDTRRGQPTADSLLKCLKPYGNIVETAFIPSFSNTERINTSVTATGCKNATHTNTPSPDGDTFLKEGNNISNHLLKYTLPYKGDIYVDIGDTVSPETLLGQNEFDPPLMYVIMLSSTIGRKLTIEEINKGLKVKINDTIEPKDKIFDYNRNQVYSPIRCIIESINYQTGTIIGREIQDYTFDPVVIDICKALTIRPSQIRLYMQKEEGDWVRYGDCLARYFPFKGVYSEHTGTIQKINEKDGTITICYDKPPFRVFAQCYGTVENIAENQEIDIKISANKLEGRIGFGHDIGGELAFCETHQDEVFLEDKIIYKHYINGY